MRQGSLLVLVLVATPAFAQEESGPLDEATVVLQPASEWQLREMDDRCRLSRRFGEGENRTTLWLDQGGAEPFYNLTMIGRPFRNLYGQFTQIKFGPDEKPSIRGYIYAKSKSGRPVMVMHGIELAPGERGPESEFQPAKQLSDERLDNIEHLTVYRAVMDPVRFITGSLKEPLEKLQTCATVLGAKLTLAGMITSENSRPPARANDDDWGDYIRYPDYLARSGVVGQVNIRLTVSKTGRAVNCQITGSNSPQVFDDEVCFGLMKKAEFVPALDENGQPTSSYYNTAIEFTIR